MMDPLLQTRLSSGDSKPHNEKPLTHDQRREIIRSLIDVLGGLYAHLPQKRARYGFDPIQQLRLLGERVTDSYLTDQDYHSAIARIFTKLRDAHTRYVPPGPLESRAAVLPILVERYISRKKWVYTASKIKPANPEVKKKYATAGFEPGVKITHWNAVPIHLAVERYADSETAGRPDARIARALDSLTIRPLRFVPMPDESWVTISFIDKNGKACEIRLDWQIAVLDEMTESSEPGAAVSQAYNPTAAMSQQAKKMLFATAVWSAEHMHPISDSTIFAANARTEVISIGQRKFGYLRIYNFQIRDDQAFIDYVASLVRKLPETGLIIDIRSNPGGNVWAAEGLLQLFSPQRIQPTLFTLIASDLTRAMAGAPQNRHLDQWAASLQSAVSSGASHAEPVPLTPIARCNNRGQIYGGPVVTIVDANTYSAGDLFAAGFVDNRIGKLVSIDAATGGGGANVWTSAQVQDALHGTSFSLPKSSASGFTLAVRQAVRYGQSQSLIEDVGIEAQFNHKPTKRDVIAKDGNRDLLRFASRVLDTEPRSAMDIVVVDKNQIGIEFEGIDQLQVEVDGTVRAVFDIQNDGLREVDLPESANSGEVELIAFSRGQLRQRRRVQGHLPGV